MYFKNMPTNCKTIQIVYCKAIFKSNLLFFFSFRTDTHVEKLKLERFNTIVKA